MTKTVAAPDSGSSIVLFSIVVAGSRVGVRRVVGGDLLTSPTCNKSFRVGPASVAETVWEVLVQWDSLTRWLMSRFACDDPGGRRVRVGGGSVFQVGVLVVERNFTECFSERAHDNFRKRLESSL
jgi:hypothetical protein